MTVKTKPAKKGKRRAKRAVKITDVTGAKTALVKRDEVTPTRQQFDIYLMSRAGNKTSEISRLTGLRPRTIQRYVKTVADWIDESPGIQRAREEIENMVTAALNVAKLKLAQGSWPVAREILQSTNVLPRSVEDGGVMKSLTDTQIIHELIGIIKNLGDANVLREFKDLLADIESRPTEIPATVVGIETTTEGRTNQVHDSDQTAE